MTGHRHCVLVLGIARSGTSATAGALAAMGVDFGSDLMSPEWQNPFGCYEHRTLLALNMAALAAVGRTWSDARPLPPRWQEHAGVRGAARRIGDQIAADFGQSLLFGIKDPRLVALFPLYVAILNEQGIAFSVVAVRRNPAEVRASIARSGYYQGKFFVLRASRLLAAYARGLEAAEAVCPRLARINYAELIAAPCDTMARLAAFLPFEAAGIHPDIAAAAAFINPRFYRNRSA